MELSTIWYCDVTQLCEHNERVRFFCDTPGRLDSKKCCVVFLFFWVIHSLFFDNIIVILLDAHFISFKKAMNFVANSRKVRKRKVSQLLTPCPADNNRLLGFPAPLQTNCNRKFMPPSDRLIGPSILSTSWDMVVSYKVLACIKNHNVLGRYPFVR